MACGALCLPAVADGSLFGELLQELVRDLVTRVAAYTRSSPDGVQRSALGRRVVAALGCARCEVAGSAVLTTLKASSHAWAAF